MSYIENLYAVENEARKYICERLDKEGQIILRGDDEELPTQPYESDFGSVDMYIIREIFKDEEGYFAIGFMQYNENNYYYFNLFENTDTDVIVEIADLISEK